MISNQMIQYKNNNIKRSSSVFGIGVDAYKPLNHNSPSASKDYMTERIMDMTSDSIGACHENKILSQPERKIFYRDTEAIQCSSGV